MTTPLLTPEMMARAIVSEPGWWQPGPEFLIDFDQLREHIAHAIAFDRGYASGARLHAAENVIHAARAVCHNPKEANITRLAMMLEAYDEAIKHTD